MSYQTVAQRLKRLPAKRETWVRSLSREDSLEKEMATHSSILHGRRSLVGYSPWGCKELDTTERLYFHFLSSIKFQICITNCQGMNDFSPAHYPTFY